MSDEFSLFPHLPAELRRKIWGFALLQPRTVHIQCGDRGFPFNSPKTCPGPEQPVLLRVNRESRDQSLAFYSRSTTIQRGVLGLCLRRGPCATPRGHCRSIIYFEPELDIFAQCVQKDDSIAFNGIDVPKIRHVQLTLLSKPSSQWGFPDSAPWAGLHNLQTLIFLVHDIALTKWLVHTIEGLTKRNEICTGYFRATERKHLKTYEERIPHKITIVAYGSGKLLWQCEEHE